jgi:hypothetical protein
MPKSRNVRPENFSLANKEGIKKPLQTSDPLEGLLYIHLNHPFKEYP